MVQALTLATTDADVVEMMDVDAYGLSFFSSSAAVAVVATVSSRNQIKTVGFPPFFHL